MNLFKWGRKDRKISSGQKTVSLRDGKNGPDTRDGIRVDEKVTVISYNLRTRSKNHEKLEKEIIALIGIIDDEDLPTVFAAIVKTSQNLGYNCHEPEDVLRILFK